MVIRNIDLGALRSFVAVAEVGGITRAAGRLNLTQSAVSMQLKRLEELLGQSLLDRTGRGVTLTPQGEQLLSYGRRILELNDEAVARMRDDAFSGEIALGVPHDIVYPHIPGVLKRFAREFPRVRVTLDSSYTRHLKARFAEGRIDLILTTEDRLDPGGETLLSAGLVWVGGQGGTAWRHRPIRLAFEHVCMFRTATIAALDAAGIPWQMAVNSDNTRSIEAAVSADLACHVALETNLPPYMEAIRHGGALPDLPAMRINLYTAERGRAPVAALARILREAWCGQAALAAE
jgi:DNA-binding transcriptional LysR family regulator